MWIARDKNSDIYLWTVKPVRGATMWLDPDEYNQYSEFRKVRLPSELHSWEITWEMEPEEVNIILKDPIGFFNGI